jgi:hypothetical protein
MKSVRRLALTGLVVLSGCDQEPLRSRTPAEPPPPAQGVQAFVQVDNDAAAPGEDVNLYVRVQFGTESDGKVGSYTGRLSFDPEALAWAADQEIPDGLRVSNPNTPGEVRFAGASATGFSDLLLYAGRFRVKKAGYADGLSLDLQELSAAATLGDLTPQLRVAPQIFLRSATP